MKEDDEVIDDFDDEETDDQVGRPKCPFCKSKSICKHLIFEYDLSFCECHSEQRKELDQLAKILKDGFFNLLFKKKKVEFIEEYHRYSEPDNEPLFELWSEAEADYKPNDDSVDFSSDTFMKLLIYIANYVMPDGDVFIKRYGSGGDLPNYDSAMVGCFAETPVTFFEDAEKTIKEYLQDIEFDSDSAQEYNARGLAKINQGNSLSAITDFSKAIYLDPKYAESYFNRGNAKYEHWDYYEAKNDYLKAVKFEPNNDTYQEKLDKLNIKLQTPTSKLKPDF